MRYFLFVLLSAFIGTFNSQGQQFGGFALTLDRDTIKMYGASVSLSPTSVTYHDVEGKERSIKQSKLADLYLGADHYINSQTYNMGIDRLQRIVMMNDRYLLTSYFSKLEFGFYVYDRNTKETLVKKMGYGARPKADLKSLDKYIVPYFHDCPDVIEDIRKRISNLKTYDYSFGVKDPVFTVSNYDCTGKDD